jgi:hypothetical protein
LVSEVKTPQDLQKKKQSIEKRRLIKKRFDERIMMNVKGR